MEEAGFPVGDLDLPRCRSRGGTFLHGEGRCPGPPAVGCGWARVGLRCCCFRLCPANRVLGGGPGGRRAPGARREGRREPPGSGRAKPPGDTPPALAPGLRAPLTPCSPAGDTGSDTPLTGRSSPRHGPPAAAAAAPEKPLIPARLQRPRAPSPVPPAPAQNPESSAAAPAEPPEREPGAGPAPGAGPGPERRGLPSAHARSAAARRVHSRRSFQRPRARRRPALLKLASLPPSCHAPPHALEQEETPL
nr:basic proline-rich protein-like [Chlorocebus sabaeus]